LSYPQVVEVSKRAALWLSAGIILVACLSIIACTSQPTAPPQGSAQPGQAQPDQAQPSQAQPGEGQPSAQPAQPATASTGGAPVTKLEIKDVKVGNGAVAKSGDSVTVDYTGWLTDGTKFDSSVDRKQPFTFALGAGQVIPGWDQGVAGMKVGGVRKLTIPPDLGYGAQGAGGVIPPNATLIFEVKLLAVK
jgi:FKBP-type peptidyl-prolyl cis-trans isomerase FkpA